MVRHRLDSVNEFARQGYWLRITCGKCSHELLANPIAIMSELHARRVGQSVERLEQKMKCSACGHRGARIAPCEAQG